MEDTYRNKGISENLNRKILKQTAEKFCEAADKGLQVDYDAPDEVFRQYMRNNIWKFSTAKNYNDCVRLSNLLVRPDGSVRPWNEFRKEAEKVVGASNRYLKTEYETIFVSAQNARLWQEIQRDKHIFPFCQFKVVLDGHTTEICEPLHNVIVSVDDPMLALYFPMNHWGCRTTVIKLRKGPPTEGVKWPEIPEAFRNNVGIAGQIFTDKNSYISNTPKDVLNISGVFAKRQQKYEELLKDENYTDVEFGDMLGLKATHKDHNFHPKTGKYEKEAQEVLFNHGNEIIMLSEKAEEGVKTPDGLLNGKIADIKTVLGSDGVLGKNNLINKIREGNTQNCEIVILQFPEDSKNLYDEARIKSDITSARKLLAEKPTSIKSVWVLNGTKIKKFRF